jgi:hypothetical protein
MFRLEAFDRTRERSPERRRSLGAVPFLAVALALVLSGGMARAAGDERPSEMPYDSPGTIPQLSPDYRQTSHKVVLITDDSISPKAVRLKEGQLVAWISYSATPVTIVFEREVARSMICHSLVNFSIVEDELRSEPIHPGEFASFCELKPGRYQYIIKRPGQALANPQHQGQDRIRGEILVGDIKKK